MSECVVRMEMPKACSWIENGEKKRCPIAEWGGACAITKQFKMPDGCRPSWCPIICQLPEGHGRLVDASYVIDVMQDELDNDVPITVDDCFQIGCKIPTIVPAEAESLLPKPTDPLPIREVEYVHVPTEVNVKTGTVTYELRERSETDSGRRRRER